MTDDTRTLRDEMAMVALVTWCVLLATPFTLLFALALADAMWGKDG